MQYSANMRDTTLLRQPGLWTTILAAGASTRLGRPKQLVRFNGKTLLKRAICSANACTPGRVLVVLGAESLRLRRHLQGGAATHSLTVNRNWQQGMGSTISHAMLKLPPQTCAVLVLLTDQPKIPIRSIKRLVQTWNKRPHAIIASSYDDTVGVPAIFPRRHFEALRSLRDDKGARQLLGDRRKVELVPIPEAAFDIDTAQDIDRL